ncbi:MAG TPA: hypothetical protein VHM25_24910 [Polyangiaceae bacterium]|nr:hypothetical protein [Polyangiaceae bacterium]
MGNERPSRSRRRWQPTLITSIIVLASQACGGNTANQSPGTGGAGGASAGAGAGAGSANAGAPWGGQPTIVLPGEDPACTGGKLLADQVVSTIGSQRVFYSWTTDEQVAELRAGGLLFSRSESPGKGRGLAMTQLAAFGAASDQPVNRLAATLAGTTFAKMRFSWPNPWATLMGWPGETYGNQLLQVTLRPEAWIATFSQARGLAVVDADGKIVDIGLALSKPERIGAIYFQSDGDGAQANCGTFSQGGVAFREFVLGNLQMVQSWSLATPDITARLQADIAILEAVRVDLACRKLPDDQSYWTEAVQCVFAGEGYEPIGALYYYELALGLPSELYYPSQDNLAALIAALKVSLPQGEPLVVNPGG